MHCWSASGRRGIDRRSLRYHRERCASQRPRVLAMTYLLIKSLHLLFVIAWMATVFYLPRILVNLAEAAHEPAVLARLQLMGRRV